MAIKNNGAIALGLATLVGASGAFALMTAQAPDRPLAATEAAAAERAAGEPQSAVMAAQAATPRSVTLQTAAATPAPAPVDDAMTIKRVLPISGPIKYGEWHWDETNVPAGPIIITVDLDARVLSIFRGGYEIGAAAVLLGTQEKPTPTGTFPIMAKARHHISSIYGSPMPYMQRLTNDGISLHATTVERHYASHGCVGMPEEFAKKVFQSTKMGDRVIITKGKMVGQGDALASS